MFALAPAPRLQALPLCFQLSRTPTDHTSMKTSSLLLLGTASLIFTVGAGAQNAPAVKPAPGAPASTTAAPAKPKAFASSDTRIYITIAEAMQFQLKAAEKLRWKMKDGDAETVALAMKLGKEVTELYTPGVTMAQERGVPGAVDKKTKTGTIPTDMTAADRAALTKVDAMNKDDKKWIVAFFEMFAKESKKGTAEAEKGAKAAQDADLKAWAEKVAALLKTQTEEIEAKHKALKSNKK